MKAQHSGSGPVALAYLSDDELESHDIVGCNGCDPTHGPAGPVGIAVGVAIGVAVG